MIRTQARGSLVTMRKPDGKVERVRQLALEIILEHPEGIRHSELRREMLRRDGSINGGTISANLTYVPDHFPDRIQKVGKGLFAPIGSSIAKEPARGVGKSPIKSGLKESDFYESFSEFLRNDLEDITAARPLGGASLKSKWGTPDVVGVYRPTRSHRINFPLEIVAAEIKLDAGQPVVAFGQAVAYRLFSTRVYVVMPKSITEEDLQRLEALCLLFGVGLVLFHPNPGNEQFEIRVRAQRHSPDAFFVNQFADGIHAHDESLFVSLFG